MFFALSFFGTDEPVTLVTDPLAIFQPETEAGPSSSGPISHVTLTEHAPAVVPLTRYAFEHKSVVRGLILVGEYGFPTTIETPEAYAVDLALLGVGGRNNIALSEVSERSDRAASAAVRGKIAGPWRDLVLLVAPTDAMECRLCRLWYESDVDDPSRQDGAIYRRTEEMTSDSLGVRILESSPRSHLVIMRRNARMVVEADYKEVTYVWELHWTGNRLICGTTIRNKKAAAPKKNAAAPKAVAV